MSWMPFVLQGLISSIGDADEGGSDSNFDNKHIEKRNEIEEKKLRQQEIANRISALSNYSDSELLEKLDNLEPTIVRVTTYTICGGAGDKFVHEGSFAEQIEDNPDYIKIKEELKSRCVRF